MPGQLKRRLLKIFDGVLIIFFLASCTAGTASLTQSTPIPSANPTNTLPAAAVPPEEPVIPQTSENTPGPETAAPTANQPPPEKDVLFQDDFTDPGSGWSGTVNFDNYYIGYHEPEFYHVEVHAPNDRAVTALPEQTFTDATLEAEVFVETNNTAAEGDFRYGLMFRRSGNQYYAFTISPNSKTWQLLKVSPAGTQELKNGSQATIQGLSGADRLRVDAQGTQLFLWVNDQLVDQVSDADYGSGEVGFFVETFDSPRVHIHFDTFTVREVQVPQYRCQVEVSALNLRESSSMNAKVITTVRYLERFEPLARTLDGSWMRVRYENQNLVGWVSNSDEFFTCSVPVEDLPILRP